MVAGTNYLLRAYPHDSLNQSILLPIFLLFIVMIIQLRVTGPSAFVNCLQRKDGVSR